jgi:hypothetical protein
MYDFLTDLDEYFCENYANYDRICSLPGYEMPVMQRSKVEVDGRTYAYTLPAERMRLSEQKAKKALLAELKLRMTDTTFSFSFRPQNIFSRVKNCFSKHAPYKGLATLLKVYGFTEEEAGEQLDISKEIWQAICKGKFLPSKNLVLSLALTAGFSYGDTAALLSLCGEEMDSSIVKDVVISYLLTRKVYNLDMIKAALAEYRVENLFIK